MLPGFLLGEIVSYPKNLRGNIYTKSYRTANGILKKDEALKGNCNYFVIETNVHYPTDTNLLFDAICKMIFLIAIIYSEAGFTECRQSHHNILKVKQLLRAGFGVQRRRQSELKMLFGVSIFIHYSFMLAALALHNLIKSLGSSSISNPLLPALTYIVSYSNADSSINVGSRLF